MKGKYLENLTWPEAEAAFKDDPIVIIPLGARLKEHAYHLPLNNDWITAEYLTKRILNELNVLATPTVQFSYFPAFTEYPGSVNINLETSKQVLLDLINSLAKHGVKKFYILNTGVSTNWVLEPLRKELNSQGLRVDYFDLLGPLGEFEDSLAEQECGTHADEIETSMMLYIAPEIVKLSLAVPEIRKNTPGGFTRDPNNKKGLYSPSGAWGDPTLATVEKGKIVIEKKVSLLLEFITELESEDFLPRPDVDRYLT